VARGERIWLSADDDRPAEASITTAYVPGGDRLRRALAQARRLLVGRWRTREARE
jgi:hypothetical protein